MSVEVEEVITALDHTFQEKVTVSSGIQSIWVRGGWFGWVLSPVALARHFRKVGLIPYTLLHLRTTRHFYLNQWVE